MRLCEHEYSIPCPRPRSSFGQLGLGDSCATHRAPAPVAAVNAYGAVRAVACGEAFTLVALATGELLSFGYGQQGQVCVDECAGG